MDHAGQGCWLHLSQELLKIRWIGRIEFVMSGVHLLIARTGKDEQTRVMFLFELCGQPTSNPACIREDEPSARATPPRRGGLIHGLPSELV